MMRVLNVAILAALVATAAGVYTLKYEATRQSEKIVRLKRDIERERDAIQELRAEWAFLSRPDRVQSLAEHHLVLKPLRVEQIARLADLPARPEGRDSIGQMLETGGLKLLMGKGQDPAKGKVP